MQNGYVVVDNLISCDEARTIINITDALLTDKDHENIDSEFKNYNRHVTDWSVISADIHARIASKLKDVVPKTVSWREQDFTFEGLARRIDLIKYDTGGIFDVHCDYLTGGAISKNFFTINLYLNETDGGHLVIYKGAETISVQPIPGRCVLVDMDTWHSSSVVNTGSKYLLKGHIAYSRDSSDIDSS